jgi:ABC-2 type transport system ATP-binding protein
MVRLLPGVAGVEIEAPNLEEIYIGYMRRRVPSGSTPVALPVA